jgi:succinate dehydrogenase / fumarate reductase flavoprotein subunit
VDADTQMCTMPGLFSAGECAAGLHGANRLGGNSLSDLIVFGQRAGENAAAYANEHGRGTLGEAEIEDACKDALAPLERQDQTDGAGPYAVQFALQDMMQEKVGIIREEGALSEALEDIAALVERSEGTGVTGDRNFNPGWHTALDLRHLLTNSEACARSALERRESRGAHSRVDFPDKDKEWGGFTVVLKRGSDGRMEVRRDPLPPIRDDLQQIIEEQG